MKHGAGSVDATVDSKWLPYLSQFRWQLEPSGYIKRGFSTRGPDDRYHSTTIRLHVEVAGKVPGLVVDHLNGNKRDNREVNLRITTHRENQRNRGLSALNKSGYKGVTFSQQHQRYKAEIHANGRRYSRFCRTPEDAAQKYDEMARKHYRESARLNFPLPGERGLDGCVVPRVEDVRQ